MISFNNLRNPTQLQLKQFGFCLAILPLVIGFWGNWSHLLITISIAVSVIILIFAWTLPAWFRYPFIIASFITIPMGIVVGELVLLVIYFLVVTPTGLIMKLTAGRGSPQHQTGEPKTNWQRKQQATSSEDYLRQF